MNPEKFAMLCEKRKSIRKYKKNLPPEKWINDMLYCATCAPSPSNLQPVRFVRLKSDYIKKNIFQIMTETKDNYINILKQKKISEHKSSVKPKKIINRINYYFRFSSFIINAPIVFIVGTIKNNSGLIPYLIDAGLTEDNNYKEAELNISLGLAIKAFILQAEAYGLGTCILSAPMAFLPDLNNICQIDDIDLKCFITVGFPDETPQKILKKPIDEILRVLS